MAVPLALCLLGTSAQADGGYRLGHGLDVGPFNIAGYSNLVVEAPRSRPKSLQIDDFSLFVTGHVGRLFNPFVEAEFTGFDLVRWDGESGADRNGDLVLERLYNDFSIDETFTVRLGKMLTPVGQWNEIHAAPLVLTAVRPAVTHRNFSEYATGIAALYSDPFARNPDVQVYWQPEGEFFERSRELAAHRYETVAGIHVSMPFGLLDNVGASFQYGSGDNGIDQTLFGFDFRVTMGRLTLQGETTASQISNPGSAHVRNVEWGGYAAASYTLNAQWSIHVWYEAFADRTNRTAAQDMLVGFGYRVAPASELRLEYLENFGGAPVNPSGFFASWSVLF
ncbi:MAG: hypothetical protein AB7K86_04720 [Rhodospirillales bacterium]